MLGFILIGALTVLFSNALAGEITATGGTLRLGVPNDIAVLNPFMRTASIHHNVRSLLFEPLLAQGDSGPRPYLAESWRISPDGTEYEFRVKSGIRFHDGGELSCEDIKWSIDYTLDPKNGAYGRPNLGMIQSVDCESARNLRVKLKEQTASFLSLMATIQSFPLVPKASLKVGELPSSFPAGTGPFTLAEWKPGQSLLLQRYKEYWQRGLPRVEQIMIRVITDDSVRFTALRTGEVDVIDSMAHQYVERIRRREIKDVNLVFAKGTGFRGLIFNVKKPPLDNGKVRQAIAYAIDKEELLKGAHWGVGVVTNQKMVPGSLWYFDIADRKKDLDKARQLLREAGISGRIRLKISSSSNVAGKEQVPILQSQLGLIGIELEPEILDQATHNARQRTGEFELSTTGGEVPPDPDPNYYPFFHSETGRIRNITGYSNPIADGLLERGRATIDTNERLKIYREFVEIVHKEVPMIPLLFAPVLYGARAHVKGFEVDRQGRYFSGDKGLPVVWLER